MTTLPLAARDAYFDPVAVTSRRLRRNFHDSPSSRQTSQTTRMVSAAPAGVALT
ncbi:hypothetical protein ILP97_23800 [Amycolatopsis sp. H6(2020)]|nr:hypothetical protein [Amycolatopsis sp. H6(2020)]